MASAQPAGRRGRIEERGDDSFVGRLRRAGRRTDVRARAIAFAVAFGYAALLWYNYRNFISPVFSYISFVAYAHSPAALALDFTLAAAPALFLPLALRRPSDLALILIYLIVYIPSIVFTTTIVTIVTNEILVLKVTMLATLALAQWVAGGDQDRRVLLFSFRPPQFMLGLVGLAVVVVGIVGMTYGFKIVLHNLADVYTQRDAFKDELEDAGYNTYLVGLLNNVLGPAMFTYGLVFRKPIYAAIGVTLALYVFSITGLKSSVSAIFYTFALFCAMSVFRRSFLVPAVIGVAIISVLGMIADITHVSDTVNGLLVRRTFVMPGVLTAYYHQYYAQNPFLYLSQSILSPFIASPQAMKPEDLIGQLYFHGGEHANASFWADGYAQAGLVGMAISATLVGLFLRAVNYCLSRMDLKFACCAMSMIFFMMTQTGIIKVIGTHGGLFACLIYLQSDLRTRVVGARRDLASRAAERAAVRERRGGGHAGEREVQA